MKIPIYLITGFLGSGKTTLVKRFLKEYNGKRRIGIVQNEFAPGNVDGIELHHTGYRFQLLKINKGSLFCLCLLSDFTRSLSDFIDENQPDAIVVEASGLADPISIGKLLNSAELKVRTYLAQVWCVLDCQNFLKTESMMPQIQHQVRISDIIIINKIDLGIDNISSIIKRVQELNPFASINITQVCKVKLSAALNSRIKISKAVERSKNLHRIKSSGRPDIGSKVLRTSNKLNESILMPQLSILSEKLYRIKGYLQLDDGSTLAYQSSFGNCKVSKIKNYQGPSELILMGAYLEKYSYIYRNLFQNVNRNKVAV